jgi:hypothetical protein
VTEHPRDGLPAEFGRGQVVDLGGGQGFESPWLYQIVAAQRRK